MRIRIGLGMVALAGLVVPAVLGQPTATAPGDKVPLEVKLPKPVSAGTPKMVKDAPNLDKLGTKYPAVMVPKDATNVALGKPVTLSDSSPTTGEAKLVTDGDKEAREGSWLEMGPGVQWVQIDLKGKHEIDAIAVWHFHQTARVYHCVVVQVADDQDFLENVQTVFNNDQTNAAGLGIGKDKEYWDTHEGRVFDAKGIKGRYVRLYSKGSTFDDFNHMTEVEVYGKPVK